MNTNNVTLKKDLYAEKVIVGRRTYFFDFKENLEGEKYLVITESKIHKEDGFKRDRIIIFSEYLEEFLATFNRVVEHVRKDEN